MAVRVDEYYERFRKRAIFGLLAGQVLAVSSTGGLLFLVGQVDSRPIVSILVSAIVFICIETIIMILLFKHVTEPIKVVSQAISHVSKQLTDLPPPNINTPRYEKSGLKNVVQTIYDLALNAPTIPNAIPTMSNASTRSMGEHGSSVGIGDAISGLPYGVVALDENGTILYSNQSAPVVVGPDKKPQLQLVFEPGRGIEDFVEAAKGKLRDNKAWSRIGNVTPDQPDRKVYDVFASFENNASNKFETVIITVDRSADYVPVEEDMDFIALAAHELRGPITVIRGYLDVINDELAPVMQPDQLELIERLNVSASRLSTYISNILNVSRYDRRHLALHLQEDSLESMVEGLRADLEMRARTQNRLLSFNIPADLPHVAADRNSLDEVISNLVDNAIKYSNEGGQVIVTATVNGNFVECTVQDYGIGIPSSVVGNLFTKFYRSHISRQTVSGTGLGLYISKAIVESHGGQVWVRSTEGQGSTFGFSLPIYATVADKLLKSDNGNQDIIESAHGWIKNHSMYRR